MKPLVPTHNHSSRFDGVARSSRRVFPKTDYNFKPSAADFGSRCGNPAEPSFRRLSENYFRKEAPANFMAELALFGVIAGTAIVPLFSNARAITHLLHSFGTF